VNASLTVGVNLDETLGNAKAGPEGLIESEERCTLAMGLGRG